MEHKNYNFGDRLIRQKGFLGTRHHALYVGNVKGYYEEMVIENQINKGVQLISLSQFKKEGEFDKSVPFSGDWQEIIQIENRIEKCLNEGYDIAFFNCETFVNYVLTGEKKSFQVRSFIVSIITVFFLFFFVIPTIAKKLRN
jgi:hypothetical protein